MSKVAELRKAQGLTQRDVADAVGVVESTIRNWENNRNSIEALQRFAKLCKVLHCSPDDLIEEVEISDDAQNQRL